MTDDLEVFNLNRPPDPQRPLQGMTALVVEDSRFASEAIRLLCLRSGARIRRADSLAAAHRHLRVYRPSIVIIDLGLPDGSGADLIDELDKASPRVAAIFGISGEDNCREKAMQAGADGFFAKPIESLGAFQQAVLARLPQGEGPTGPRIVPNETIKPDPLSLQDDLSHMAEVVNTSPHGKTLDYIAQFLAGVARSSHDNDLEAAATGLAKARARGGGTSMDLARVAGILHERLQHVTTV
ncbi:MAG: response regulator [Rhodobacteraceae bacterium]|nr:response regulator [Paracoccaceae bacterium]